jgi:ABC-2 type transport system ATP-binding protein
MNGHPISVRGLTDTRGDAGRIHDVSFDVEAGSIAALIGPNGAGKSTTIRALFGLVGGVHGDVTFDGAPYRSLPRPAQVVGALLDPTALHPGRSVRETAITMGMMVGVGRERSLECVDAAGLGHVHRRRVGALSLGMQQRLGLALALLGSPRTLVLDEPANGLDPEGSDWLYSSLVEHARAGGSVLLSSHDLEAVAAIAGSVVLLDGGKVVQSFATSQLIPEATDRWSRVASADDERLIRELRETGILVRRVEGCLLVGATAARVGVVARDHGIAITHLADDKRGMRSAFLEATTGSSKAGHVSGGGSV